MAEIQYAMLKDNKVINILVFDDSSEELLSDFYTTIGCDNSVPIPLGNTTVIGAEWDGENLIPPKPYDSWLLTLEGFFGPEWYAPVPYPFNDEKPFARYTWNESIVNWQEVVE